MSDTEALEIMARAGRQIVEGVRESLPVWAEASVARLVDAWGRHDPLERHELRSQAEAAGQAAATRIVAELEALFSLDPDDQQVTPLQVIRTAFREPAAVLERASVPPVVRDEFDEQVFPEDVYGLAPRTLADLGSESLAEAHLVWGAAKARVHKARRG